MISMGLVLRSCSIGFKTLNWKCKKRMCLFCQKEGCYKILEAYAI